MKRIFILFIALVCVAAPLSAQKRELGKVRTVVIDPINLVLAANILTKKTSFFPWLRKWANLSTTTTRM